MTAEPPPDRTPTIDSYLDRLHGRINYERRMPGKYAAADFKLDRMAALLRSLGDPQLQTPCVHVAGTKGKGSVATAAASVLTAAGTRTGLFTSPHVRHFEERIRVDGGYPPVGILEAAFGEVFAAVEELDASGDHATYFEIATGLAWCVFRAAGCRVAVMEVGLGGRLDSTNLCRPLVCCVTSISRDHAKLLGDTLRKIAAEKAGILKAGVPVVSGAGGPAAGVIRARAADLGCRLWTLGDQIRAVPSQVDPLLPRAVDVRTPRGVWRLPVVLPGRHQEWNAALVAGVLDSLPEDLRPGQDAATRGLGSLSVPLRIEVVRRRPLTVLDAAHNGASVAALRAALKRTPRARTWLLFGTSGDKHVEDMLRELEGFADRVLVTAFVKNPRAVPAGELAGRVRQAWGGDVTSAETPAEALRLIEAEIAGDDLLVVTGSFFLAGEARELLVGP